MLKQSHSLNCTYSDQLAGYLLKSENRNRGGEKVTIRNFLQLLQV